MCGQRTDDQEHVDGGQNIEVYAGEELDVVLADLPGAGYEWVPRAVPVGLVLLGTDWADPESSEPGASRRRTFRFAAQQPGSYGLAFDLVRPWEPPDVAPARQHTVAVVVRPRAERGTMRELPPVHLIVETRRSLHRVAEHVLSAALKTATGQIALEPGPGGFRTPPLPGGRVVAVEGTDITVTEPHGVRRARLTTLADAARLAGIEPGFPWTMHPPSTPLEPDEPLAVDPDAAAVLAGWFTLGSEALGALAAAIPGDSPSGAALYPEHFDLAVVAAEVNYGVSPGDEDIELPYLYVGPHEGPPAADDFWNAPFGAYRTIHDVTTPEDALAFFQEGRDRVHGCLCRSFATFHVDMPTAGTECPEGRRE